MTVDLEQLLARGAVIDTITRLFIATDRKEWAEVERCFTEQVRFDMSSIGAGPEQTKTAAEIAEGWRQGLAPIEAVHHQAGNFRVLVGGDRATAFCYGIAYHYKPRRTGGSTRVFVGSYDFTLERRGPGDDWRISAMRFALKFIEGNRELEADE
ncbi:MAG TPA: nuclear transport factor 2 family protein [Gemmatimonadaceae bacterium]|nr:nuclear transport factor 2 family protein [Gemmatimonadaceae bacterium]